MSRKLVRTVAGKACFGLLAIAGTQSRRLDNTARVRTTGNNTFEGLPDLCLDGMKTQCFPQNYVIGAQKSGSTSLYILLSRTFTVCGAMVPSGYNVTVHEFPSFYRKETHYLTEPWGDDRSAFTKLYSVKDRAECSKAGFVEATPENIFSREAPKRLHDMLPTRWRSSTRFVVVFREPVSRMLSSFNHQIEAHSSWSGPCSQGFETTRKHGASTFEDYAKCMIETEPNRTDLEYADYATQLETWCTYFQRSQILVFEMAQMLTEASVSIERIRLHLRLPLAPAAANSSVFPHSNEKNSPEKVTVIPCSTKMALRSKFQPWMKKYYALMRKQRREGLLPPEEPLLQEFKCTVPCGKTTNRKNQDVAKFSKSSPKNMGGTS